MDEFYSVESLARACGTTPRAVRLYVEMGLLLPLRAGRTYVFTEKSARKLEAILREKRLGFTLDAIKARLEAPTADRLEGMIRHVETVSRDAGEELVALKGDLDRIKGAES